MSELKILNFKNEVIGKENADDTIFKTTFKPYLLHDYVTMQRRSLRQGTHSTKTRAEVSGTGKKPFRQKGTGQARQGTLIGPHQPGGGIAFGPKPRSYETDLNKKTKAEALRVALSQKHYEGKLALVENFDVPSGKTKDAVKLINGIKAKSVLIVADVSESSLRAVRNIPTAKALSPKGLNVFDLLKFEQVLLTKDALKQISTRLQKAAKKVRAA
jgi:large subunit ribosomal protein L4